MNRLRLILSWPLLGAALSVSSVNAQSVRAEAYELLYSGAGDQQQVKLSDLGGADLDVTHASASMGALVRDFLRFAREYAQRDRSPFPLSLDELLHPDARIMAVVVFSVVRGGKGVAFVDPRTLQGFEGMDRAKTYALSPLVPGYECELMHLGFDSGSDRWRLLKEVADSSGGVSRFQPQRQVECVPRHWSQGVVEVEFGYQTPPPPGNRFWIKFPEFVTNLAYDEIDRQTMSGEPQFVSYRAANRPNDFLVSASPSVQYGFARKADLKLRLVMP